MLRRVLLYKTSVGVSISVSGCLSSEPFPDWGFEEREAEAWSFYSAHWEAVTEPDEMDENGRADARQKLDAGSDIYSDLATEAAEHGHQDINDFFNTMSALMTAAVNYLEIYDGVGDHRFDADAMVESIETHHSDARSMWRDLDELREAVDGERF